MGRGGRARLSPVARFERAGHRAGREAAATDVDHRADEDADHVVEKRVSLDDDRDDAGVRFALDVDARERPHRVVALVARGAEGDEVVRPERGTGLERDGGDVDLRDAPRAHAQRRVANGIDEHAITIALAARGEPGRVAGGDGPRAAHGDVFREVLVEAEDPAARGDLQRGVERGELPLGVYARVGAARAAHGADARIHGDDRSQQRLLDRAHAFCAAQPWNARAVVRHLEQHAV